MTGDERQTTDPPVRVALLRGINLGGGRTVPMARLRDLAEGLGWTDVATHLQSGNLLFRSPEPDADAAAGLSSALAEGLGIAVDVVVRTGGRLQELVDSHPFADGDPSRVVIACCDRAVGELAARRLADLATGAERVRLAPSGTDVFASFPAGQAGSRLAAGLVGALRPATGTARNLRTMARLAELAQG